jgi:quinol monooxygenase YgiN
MGVVRISLGRFDPDKFHHVRQLLDHSQKTLVPAIRALKGNNSYYVGIDQENSTKTNVSIWETLDDAKQMATLQAMLDLAKEFISAGVRFERPITNHQTLWHL